MERFFYTPGRRWRRRGQARQNENCSFHNFYHESVPCWTTSFRAMYNDISPPPLQIFETLQPVRTLNRVSQRAGGSNDESQVACCLVLDRTLSLMECSRRTNRQDQTHRAADR